MKIYKICGFRVTEPMTTHRNYIYWLESGVMPKWVSRVFCTVTQQIIELSFNSLNEAEKHFKTFGYDYTTI